MKKFLLLFTALFASFSSFAQGNGELVSNDVTISLNDGCRMFIKKYSDEAIKVSNEKIKLVVRYLSDDETIVKPEGNVFRGVGLGTCNVTQQVSTAYPGQLDAFDDRNIIMSNTFKVTVLEDAPFKIPTFELSWGLDRAKSIANQESWGHDLITSEYLKHTPNVIENNPEYVKQVEVFYNNSFDVPITMSQYNASDNQLIATTVAFAAWEKVTSKFSYMYKWLINKGFKPASDDNIYWNLVLENEGVITSASWEMVVMDNVWFASTFFQYGLPDDPSGIDNVKDDFVKFDIQTSGNTINVNAPEFAGRKLIVSDLSGKLISSQVVQNAGNTVNVPAKSMYIVKIDGVRSVKVLL